MLSVKAKNNTLWYVLRSLEAGMQAICFWIVLLMLSYNLMKTGLGSVMNCLMISGIPVLVLYLARLFIKNNVLIIIIHVGIALFFIMLGRTGDEKFVNIVFAVALLVYSLGLSNANKKEGAEKMPIGFVCLFVIAMMLGEQADLDSMVVASMYSGGMFIILQVLYLNFDSVNKYIMMNRGIADLPVRQIVSVNSFQMSVLVTLFCGIMFLFSNKYVNRMVEIISGFIGDIVKYILRMLFSIGKDLRPKAFVPESLGGGNGMNELWALVEDSIWTDILNAIGMIFGSLIGIILVIALCAVITIILLKKLKNMSFHSEGDIKEFLIPRDIAEFQFKRSKKDKREKGTGDNYKARKIYKAQVIKAAAQKGDTIGAAMLPCEISELYLGNAAKQVTDIYEKARYSDRTITKEEIVSLRNYLK